MATVTDSDLQEIKDMLSEIKIAQARVDEKLDAMNTNLSDLKKQVDKQDNRLWLLISSMFFALVGILSKLVLFPNP